MDFQLLLLAYLSGLHCHQIPKHICVVFTVIKYLTATQDFLYNLCKVASELLC